MKKLFAGFVAAVCACISLSAFAANWTYTETDTKNHKGTITDGVWTFNVSVSGSNMTIGLITDTGYPNEISPLDFSKKVVKDGDETVEYAITSIGSMFYYYSSGAKYKEGHDFIGEFTLPGEGLITMGGDGPQPAPNMFGDIVIPSTVTSIGRGWFIGSKITSITFGASTTTIAGGYSLGICQNCHLLKSVVFPAEGNFTLKEGFMFSGCKGLESADLSGVVSVATSSETDGGRAYFNGCTNLTTLTIGAKLTRFPLKVLLNNNPKLETVRFLSAPPAELGTPFLNDINNSQKVTTVIPYANVNDWKKYAADETINDLTSTWAAEYVKSGVDLTKRLLVYYVAPELKPPSIKTVSVGVTTDNSIEISVSGEYLNGGTVTITLDDGVNPPISSGELSDFGSYTFNGLPADTRYSVLVSAVNDNGSDSYGPFVTGTYGTTTLAARMYYKTTTRVATFVYDNVNRTNDISVMQFDLGANGGSRGWLKSDFTLIDGFNPVSAVFDASFKQFKPTDLSRFFNKWGAMNSIVGIENLDTSDCTTMQYMFYHVDSMTVVDMSAFKTLKVTNMGSMFQWSAALVTLYANEEFSTQGISASANLFEGASSLVGGNGTKYSADHKLADYAVVDTPLTPGYFTYKAPPARKVQIESVAVSGVALSNATVSVAGSDLQGGTITVKMMVDGVEKAALQRSAFGDFVFDDLSDETTYQVVVIGENASGITQDESCGFTTWGIVSLGARAVYWTEDRSMHFYYDNINRSTTAGWSVDFGPNGERTWGTPSGSDWVQDNTVAKIVIDPSFAAYRPKTCAQWFSRFANNNTSVAFEGIENLNTSEATSLSRMFYNFRAGNIIDLSGFRTSKVTNLSQMFGYGGWSAIDLSSFDTRNVTVMGEMFVGGGNIVTIYASERFVTTKVATKKGGDMFLNCKKLEGQNGTRAYVNNVATGNPLDYTYARIDYPESPGYFTYKACPYTDAGLMIIFR